MWVVREDGAYISYVQFFLQTERPDLPCFAIRCGGPRSMDPDEFIAGHEAVLERCQTVMTES